MNAELSRRAYLTAGNELVCPGTPGSELVDELKADPGLLVDADLLLRGEFQDVGPVEWLMYKPRWSAFYRTRLEEHLRRLGVDTVVIAGFPVCKGLLTFVCRAGLHLPRDSISLGFGPSASRSSVEGSRVIRSAPGLSFWRR